ncbi:GNAT family N-acetyltransferase [Streptomyces lavendulae]|uniref:GNAT family N-acetyltransferase n=1 Tax=Streptomyces lavendulae TaxID=1914 RepID=UPI003691048B
MSDLIVRSLQAGESELFESFGAPAPQGTGPDQDTYRTRAEQGQYRPEWTWVALEGGVPVARAAFWGLPDGRHPIQLTFFDPGSGPDRHRRGRLLLEAAYAATRTEDGERPRYRLKVLPGWRDSEQARRAIEERVSCVTSLGMALFVERLSFSWTPADGLPSRNGALTFGPAADDDAVCEVLARISDGTLDVGTRANVERVGRARAADEELALMQEMYPSSRPSWRLAYLGGEAAGIVVPAKNLQGAQIAYIGLVPEYRGRGHVDQLLAEGTHILAATGVDEVWATTDHGNAPMAAAFARSGYRNDDAMLIYRW